MTPAVDYATDRPSKLVSRRILLAMLGRLQAFQRTSDYSYVGFGSYQFLDFDLVHRELGIDKMMSIEENSGLVPRCEFNVPFKSISVLEGSASTILPSLDWSLPIIVWLDYTQRLRAVELGDIEAVALRLQPGSVLAVTLNCVPGEDGSRRQALENAVGAENVPIGASEARLAAWGLAGVQRELVTAKLLSTFAGRGDGTAWQQLLNLQYRDGAQMQVLAGIVDSPAVHDGVLACKFEDMDEVRIGGDPLLIEIPSLTRCERQAASKRLPNRQKLTAFAGLSEKDLASYAKFYRWLDPAS